jgi:hypothetical protein
LSVKNPVGEPIPALPNEIEERREVSAFEPFFVFFCILIAASRGKDAGDILPNEPPGAKAFSQCKIFEGEVAARIIQADTLSGDGEGLARCSADEKIDWSGIGADFREVAMVRDSVIRQRFAWHVGAVMMRKHSGRECRDLSKKFGRPA